MEETVDTSGRAFVDFWGRMAAKGDMNKNTAGAFRAAAQAVLEVEQDWESLDVRTLDVERVLRRYVNRMSSDMKQSSLQAYLRRFKQGHELFMSFVEDPAAWRPPARQQGQGGMPKAERAARKTSASAPTDLPTPGVAPTTGGANAIEYPCVLRGGSFIARLRVPMDVTRDDVKRITALLTALAVDDSGQGK